MMKIAVIILGATGFWKIIELLIKFRFEQRLKKAEIRSLDIQANSQVVENWVQWSEKMEKRISELEAKNKELMVTIGNQRKRITDLNKYVGQLEKEINDFKK
ncbi:hypothetical protein [Flavivirga rizhaonensis]|nr:hypothetical protein [Flavivirga rizhaonensis]